jgi:hypothetical protein
MHNQQLNEGLRPLDLENTVSNLFEIDSHRSKMGEDRDICVLTFKVSDRNPAKDLMEFIEKGFSFVLDSDVSTGENADGDYFVFVELNRTPNLAEQIKELTYGVKKLTGINEWKFKYHKMPKEFNLATESLERVIPPTPADYDNHLNNVKTEGVKKFFSKTLLDNLTLDGDIITIYKPFNQKIQLRLIDQGDQTVLENNVDPVSLDTSSTSEVFWLTKVLGDYNITKLGNSLVFDNNGQKMILQRIE